MATDSQINANRENAKHSTGPKTPEGLAASSRNNLQHGLVGGFSVLAWEDRAKFDDLAQRLQEEHKPSTPTEALLVERMAQHFWLSERALTLQSGCFNVSAPACDDEKRLALYMRYHAAHERAFYRAIRELQKLRKQRTQAKIGFEQQLQRKTAEFRKIEIHKARLRNLHALAEERKHRSDKQKSHDSGEIPFVQVVLDPDEESSRCEKLEKRKGHGCAPPNERGTR